MNGHNTKKYFTGFGADTVDTGTVGDKTAGKTLSRASSTNGTTGEPKNLCQLKTRATNGLAAQPLPLYSAILIKGPII